MRNTRKFFRTVEAWIQGEKGRGETMLMLDKFKVCCDAPTTMCLVLPLSWATLCGF